MVRPRKYAVEVETRLTRALQAAKRQMTAGDEYLDTEVIWSRKFDLLEKFSVALMGGEIPVSLEATTDIALSAVDFWRGILPGFASRGALCGMMLSRAYEILFVEPEAGSSHFSPVPLAYLMASRLEPPGFSIPDSLRVIDPTCGSGVLLCAALDRLTSTGVDRKVILPVLDGRDINLEHLQVAELTMALAMFGDENYSKAKFEANRLAVRKHRILSRADALSEQPGSLDASIILANPPWGGAVPAHRFVSRWRTCAQMITVTPSSFWSDVGARALRESLIFSGDKLTLFEFDNKDHAFAVHPDSRFTVADWGRNPGEMRITRCGTISAYFKNSPPACELIASDARRSMSYLAVPDATFVVGKPLAVLVGTIRSGKDRPFRLSRELDLTMDRKNFYRSSGSDRLPLIEGRMLAPYSLSAKEYVAGVGRSARWQECKTRNPARAQYYVEKTLYLSRLRRTSVATKLAVKSMSSKQVVQATLLPDLPCANSLFVITAQSGPTCQSRQNTTLAVLCAIFNSSVFRREAKRRLRGNNLSYPLLLDCPVPGVLPAYLEGRSDVEIDRLCERIEDLVESTVSAPDQQREKKIDALVCELYAFDCEKVAELVG